jgi:secreted trypsin-like serine protease
LRHGDEAGTRHAGRYLLALVFATLLALGAAVPVFAAEEPTGEGTTAEDSTTEEDGGGAQPQVVGGDPVREGKYEFVAALLDKTKRGSDYRKQFCGGTLIDQDSVLTAAHCLEGTRAVQVEVVVGRAALDSDDGQKRNVLAIVRHPQYTTFKVSSNYDAAVLQLDSPVTGITPIELPATTRNAFETPGRKLTIAGWGNTRQQSPPNSNEPNRFPNRMQEAEVPVVSDRAANRVYDRYTRRLMVAAGREGKDTCQGDSGGPMFERTDRGFYQVGITSFGAGCGARNFPGVYTEVNNPSISTFIEGAAAD